MRKPLLLALAIAAIPGLNADMLPHSQHTNVGQNGTLKASYATMPAMQPGRRAAKNMTVQQPSLKISPTLRRSAAATAEDEFKFFESFEGWDGTTQNWAPEGWEIQSKGDPTLKYTEKWGTDKGNPNLPTLPDGTCAAMISYAQVPQDEWLITPSIAIDANEKLGFWLYANPGYIFDLSLIDWTNDVFKEYAVVYDVEVLVKPEDGEWTTAWKLSDEYNGMAPSEISRITPNMQAYLVSLNEYAGKNVQFAFRYVGTDGDTVMLDLVTIGLASFENAGYILPFETLFNGYGRQAGWDAMTVSIAYYPVGTPITWYNRDYVDPDMTGAPTYTWSYRNPETHEWESGHANESELTLTYNPDYTDIRTSINNWYEPPVLSGVTSSTTPGDYKAPHARFQAGGAPEFILMSEEGEMQDILSMSLLPFDINSEGSTFIVIDDPEIGDPAIPIFGYNDHCDAHWLNYTLNGHDKSEGDDVRLTSIMNYLYPAGAPLVVNGVHVLGIGQVPENAAIEFKIEIVPLNDEGVPEMENPVASATCTAADLIRYDFGTNQLLTIPFDFSAPAVIDDSHVGYMVRFSGFHNPEITYFAPLQSQMPHPDYMAFGWIEKEIKIDSEIYRSSYTPIAYVEGEYGPCYNAFAMNLSAFYPWLETETEEVTLPADGSPVTVKLGSYYDGSQLDFSTIAGLEASAEGRYGNCTLTLARNDAAVNPEGTLSITAPGVKKEIKISSETGSIQGIASDIDNATPIEAFTPDGKRINPANTASGIVFIRYSDGSVRKTVAK